MSNVPGEDNSEHEKSAIVPQTPERNDLPGTPPEPYRSEPLPGLLGEVQNSWHLFLDPRVPAAVKLLPFLFIAVYFLVPVDLVPDPLLGAGQMDDLGILVAALFLFRIIAPNYIGTPDQSSQVSSQTGLGAGSEILEAEYEGSIAKPAAGEDANPYSSAIRPQGPEVGYGPPYGPAYVRAKGQGNCGVIMLVLSLIVLALLIALLVLGVGVFREVAWFVRDTPAWISYNILHGGQEAATPSPVPSPTPVDIYVHLRTVGKLEVLHYTTQMVMDERRHECVVGEERLLYVAHGEAVMGVDLEKMREGDITVEGKRVVLRLPPPQAFHAFLDVEKSYAFHHWVPVVCPDHKEEMIKAAQVRAKSEIEAAADSEEVRKIAETYSKSFLQLFLMKLGFEDVEVILAEPDVEGLEAPLTGGAVDASHGGENTVEPARTPVPRVSAPETPTFTSSPVSTATRTPALTATSTLTVTVTPSATSGTAP